MFTLTAPVCMQTGTNRHSVTYMGTDFEDCGDNTDLLSLWILLNTVVKGRITVSLLDHEVSNNGGVGKPDQ